MVPAFPCLWGLSFSLASSVWECRLRAMMPVTSQSRITRKMTIKKITARIIAKTVKTHYYLNCAANTEGAIDVLSLKNLPKADCVGKLSR